MAVKCWKTMEKISLSNKEKNNYENNTGNKTNLDQANNRYLLQF